MTMIERVARALARQYWKRLDAGDSAFAMQKYPGGVDQYQESQWRLYADDARAAIEAMCVPTEAMTAAGYADMDSRGDDKGNPQAIFTAMIDAALRER